MAYINNYQRISVQSVPKELKVKDVIRLIVSDVEGEKIQRVLYRYKKTNYGERKFFICPICDESKQYLYYVGGIWKCSSCSNLKYKSTYTYRNGMDYCDLKIDKILDQLNLYHDIKYYTGDLLPYIKPKYMRWEKYNRLRKEMIHWQEERDNRWFRFVQLKLSK